MRNILAIIAQTINFFFNNGTIVKDFLQFVMNQATKELRDKIEIETRQQSESLLWLEFRFGRITASTIHEAAYCQTKNDCLVKKLLGASTKFDTK